MFYLAKLSIKSRKNLKKFIFRIADLFINILTECLFKNIMITSSEKNENKDRRINKANQFKIAKKV